MNIWYCSKYSVWRNKRVEYMQHDKVVKPPLHRTATFVPPLSDQKNGKDAQWSPKPRKFCFCVNAAARPLCLPWTTKAAEVAQQVAQRRQSEGRTIAKVAQGLPWSPNGGTVVATVIAQWTLLVRQRRHHGGTRNAEASLRLIHNVHNSTHFLQGDQWPTTVHPFCDHGDVCAFLLPLLSDLWVTDLLGDFLRLFWTCLKLHGNHGVHRDVWMSCVPPLNDQGNHSAFFLPSTATRLVLWSHKGGTKVAAPVWRGYYIQIKMIPPCLVFLRQIVGNVGPQLRPLLCYIWDIPNMC